MTQLCTINVILTFNQILAYSQIFAFNKIVTKSQPFYLLYEAIV